MAGQVYKPVAEEIGGEAHLCHDVSCQWRFTLEFFHQRVIIDIGVAFRMRRDADQVYVTPVYAAGEDPVPGVDAQALVAGLKSRGHRAAATVADQAALARVLAAEIGEGDLVVCLGAGDITKWAAVLPDAISQDRGG